MSHLPMLDHQRSSFGGSSYSRAYTPYGAAAFAEGPTLGFCGQLCERPMGTYQLGNGYRCYSPTALRFLSPDRFSPFGRGGLNAYGYCGGDPVNRSDPGGGWWGLVRDAILSGLVFQDGARDLHKSLGNRREVQAKKVNSVDHRVLNEVAPTVTRLSVDSSEVALGGLAFATNVLQLAGVAVNPVVGSVASWVGFGLWGAKKVAQYREARQAQNSLHYLTLSSVKQKQKIPALFGQVREAINASKDSDLSDVVIQQAHDEILQIAGELRRMN
ncbi:RHS repeat-associated core domain-containing protein [Pseudomonas sp. CAM1A]|uniref:RHS repeat-associated core domain-containing protein n=1 Tax=Pseudomonas sp. CAM1A TaxID=3231717 RepID=UPI0039C75986